MARIATGRWILAILAAIVLLTAAVWVGTIVVFDPTRYARVLDGLGVPATWQLAATDVNAPGLDGCVPGVGVCPAVTRYYLVDAEPEDAFTKLKEVAASAGFSTDRARISDCETNGGTAVTCYLGVARGSDHLWVVFYPRGGTESYTGGGQSHTVGAPGRSLVRITAAGSY